jgi:hypothetical protein
MDAGCCRLFSRAVTRLPGAERGGRAYRAATEREAVEVTAADAAELLDSAGLENNQVMDPRALYQRGEVVAHAAADEALLGAYKVTGYLGGGGFGARAGAAQRYSGVACCCSVKQHSHCAARGGAAFARGHVGDPDAPGSRARLWELTRWACARRIRLRGHGDARPRAAAWHARGAQV